MSRARELRLSLLVQRFLMKFSRRICGAVVALASLAMTAQSYAKGGRGGHGGHGGRGGAHGQHGGGHGGHRGGHGQHGGGHHGGHKQHGGGNHGDHKHHRGGHHRNYGWVGPAFYGYGYGYGYPYNYYYYGPYPYSGAYPTVYRRYVVADYYALVVSVQKALARRGYYRGPIDGIAGKGTRRAILTYRADNGLRVISRIDNELLKAL